MQVNRAADRAAIIDMLFGQICRATPGEARSLSMILTESERADMALFCYARNHLREQGRSIAAACNPVALVRAGGAAGQALLLQITAEEGTWGAVVRPERKRVSLGGRYATGV